jgi:outer membrane lipase/esterase
MRTKQIILASFLCVFLVFSTVVLGHAYSSILAFGDSLSDNGFYQGYPGGTPGNTNPNDIYGFQYFTNGPVWVEYLADPCHLNVPFFDMAYGGATTSYDNPAAPDPYKPITGLQWQIETYESVYTSVPGDALVTVWAGANDFFQGREYDTAAQNVTSAVQELADAGGNYFLIPFLPDIGLTPGFLGTPLQGIATDWSQAFNMYLAADLLALALTPGYDNINYYILDTFTLLRQFVNNPEQYGFTDVSTSGEGNPSEGYLFWDEVHPTTDGHEWLAYYAMEAIGEPIPEPATILLLGLGIVGLTGVRRRFQK